VLQRGAQGREFRRACQLGPALLHPLGGGVRERGDRRAAFGEEDQLRAMVARVRAALDVAGPLELVDGLGHGLLAHARQLGQP
jgi:hypothetical protein